MNFLHEFCLTVCLNAMHTRNEQVIDQLRMLICESKEVRMHVDKHISTFNYVVPLFLQSNVKVATDWYVLKIVSDLRQMTLTKNCGHRLETYLRSDAFDSFRSNCHNLVNRADVAARIMPLCDNAGLMIEFPSYTRTRFPTNEGIDVTIKRRRLRR